MNANKTRRAMVWLMMGLSVLALAACGGRETGPGKSVTEYPAPPTEDPAKGDEEGLEALGGGYEWRRVGGIAGFCDVVTVNAATATVASCRSDPPEALADLTLTAEQSQQVEAWLEDLAPFEHEQNDGAVADGMTVTLVFVGQGDGEATADDIAAMEALAMELLREAADR